MVKYVCSSREQIQNRLLPQQPASSDLVRRAVASTPPLDRCAQQTCCGDLVRLTGARCLVRSSKLALLLAPMRQVLVTKYPSLGPRIEHKELKPRRASARYRPTRRGGHGLREVARCLRGANTHGAQYGELKTPAARCPPKGRLSQRNH